MVSVRTMGCETNSLQAISGPRRILTCLLLLLATAQAVPRDQGAQMTVVAADGMAAGT